jgi:hypothetical protein
MFYGVVCNTHLSGVVAMHWCLWLRMAHFGQCEPKYNARLAIMVQGTEFCLGCGGNNELQNCCAYVESAIQTNWFAFAWHPYQGKMTICPASGFGF